jgi:hypothetical protein
VPAVLLSPDGQQYAYTVSQQPSDYEQPAESWVYVAPIGPGDQREVFYETTEPSHAVTPVGWSADGTKLVLDEMPQGIGGYILYWTHRNTRILDLATGAITPFGNEEGYADGWSDYLRFSAYLEWLDSEAYILHVTDHVTGTTTSYPAPALDEVPGGGGGVVFSPGATRVAYQLARYDPENERLWTVVIDLDTGDQRVVFEEAYEGWDAGYVHISGWLDEDTLVIGSVWSGDTSAIVDVTTGQFLREERGVFLGYAVGITNASGLAPSGPVTSDCPGAPEPRLQLYSPGRITFTSGSDTNVRAWPGTDYAVIETRPEGAPFLVHAGPFCADGYAWWKLEFEDGLIGFVAEGMPGEYWLEPQ